MCGRYAITTAPEAIRRLFRYSEQPNFPPRYNVAPTQPIPLVRLAAGERHFALMRWGFIPSWVKDPKTFSLVINARAETAFEKPAFRNAIRRRRCLLPVDGFYEWKRLGDQKQPFFIRRRDHAPFAFGGVWESWMGPGGEEMDTAAIVTTQANGDLQALHHRMPVIVPEADFDAWLREDTDPEVVMRLASPTPVGQLEMFAVSDAVNKVVNDGPGNLDPVPERVLPLPPAPKPAKMDDDQMSLF